MSWIAPITLNGKYVSLVPLTMEHCTDLIEAARDGELWKLWFASVPAPDRMADEIKRRLDLQNNGSMLPFTVINNLTGQLIGMTTYMDINAMNKRVEIGFTWYSSSMQKTAVNTECKLLLLTHAFEVLQCIAVRLSANFFNVNSQKAIERLGAKLDGVLRNHRIMPNGVIADYCIYTIINSEWFAVKTNLQSKLL